MSESRAELAQRLQQLSLVVVEELSKRIPDADDATLAVVLGLVVGSFNLIATDREAFFDTFRRSLYTIVGDKGEKVLKAIPVAGNA